MHLIGKLLLSLLSDRTVVTFTNPCIDYSMSITLLLTESSQDAGAMCTIAGDSNIPVSGGNASTSRPTLQLLDVVTS